MTTEFATIESQGAAWSLRILDGPLAGSMWTLGDMPLVVGRGLGCHIRLDDPSVSRNHCNIRLTPEGPQLVHVSERGETLVNGVPCATTILQQGDVLEISQYRLMMTIGAGRRSAWAEDNSTTLSVSEALLTRESYDPALYVGSPDLTEDLHALFLLLRQMSRAESLEVLVSTLRAHLLHHLEAEECWVGWQIHLDGELALYPPPTPEEIRRAPLAHMRDVCLRAEGVLTAESGEGRSMLAAPLVHGASAFGAVVVRQKLGAAGYAARQLDYLVSVAECAAPLVRAVERLEQLRRDEEGQGQEKRNYPRMLGSSTVSEKLRGELRRAALARSNVLIVGETGVGKELAARTVHELSPRSAGPYVTVNCAAIPAELFESEVFGHEKGAFSGAVRQRKGLFEMAHGGTLFLDEVGDLSLPNQARMLRAVELGTFRRLGAESEVVVDVRVVSATNRPLPDPTASYFRPDLYHRLAGIEVTLPPLRERVPDIPELAQYFLGEFGPHAPARPRSFSSEAIEALKAHPWPGNIRELKNTIERACYQAARDVISIGELNLSVGGAPGRVEDGLGAAERRHIVSVLEQHGWRVAEAAVALGLSKSTMYYKLARHGIDVKRRRA